MNRHSIITLPHIDLRKKSKKVSLEDPALQTLIKDMESATLDWEDHREHEFGVALAAVQIDVLKKVVVIRNNFEDKEDRTFIVLINPQITRREGKIVEDHEGCLSVKDMYGLVPRYEKIKVKALGIDGREFRIKAEGFLARVLQHEIDHTNGTLFIDHIKNEDAFFMLSKETGKLEKVSHEEIKRSKELWAHDQES